MNVNADTIFNNAFYVTDKEVPNAFPMIAIRPHIYMTSKGQEIHWDNFGRGMTLPCKKVVYEPNEEVIDSSHPPKIIITLENGKVFILCKLTSDVQNNKMPNKKLKFDTDEECQKFHLTYDADAEAYRNS